MTSRLAVSVPVDAAFPTDAHALATYQAMLGLRRFQEKMGLLVAMGLIAEPPASFTGRESACVAIAAVKDPGEIVVAPVSEHLFLALALGTPFALLFAEVLGDKPINTAASKLICAPSASAALTTAQEQAVKASCTFLSLSSRNIEACDLERGLAAAATAKLPLVTVLSVPAEDTTVVSGGLAYHDVVDGLDAVRVENAVAAAASKARGGGGPALIIVRTPAFQGHVAAQNRAPGAKGSTREESDPLARLRSRILAESRSNEAALKAIEKTVREAIANAAKDARGSYDLTC